MGLIKTIFGSIFGFIGGIFGAVAKIFGVGKQGEFYMELDDAAAPTVATVTAAPAPAPAAPKEVVEKPSEPVSVAAPAPTPVTTPTPAAAVPATPMVTNFATDYLVNPRISQAPRRRPGPSLSPFKNMVKDMGRKSPSMG